MQINPEIFSEAGYVSVGLWVAMPLLWLLHWIIRPRRYLIHLAFVAGIAALVLATINSDNYVNRLQQDRSEEIARAQKAIEEARLRKEKERSKEVVSVSFIEDDRGDAMDKGGMDDDDLAYYSDTPKWKKDKVERDQSAKDGGMEGAIGAVEEVKGVIVAETEEESQKPIVLPIDDYEMAQRLDALNLKVIRIMVLLALAFILFDYLRRFNNYRDAYMPLPLPSSWTSVSIPLPPLQEPKKRRRKIKGELKVMAKRGDTFIYLTDSAEKAEKLPAKIGALLLKAGRKEILPVDFEGERLSDDFVFDALWFGQCCFKISNREEIDVLLARFVELLAERKKNRGHANRSVHLVWDCSEPVPDVLRENLMILGPSTGFSLFVCNANI